MLRLAGVAFRITPDGALLPAERVVLATLQQYASGAPEGTETAHVPFDVELLDEPPFDANKAWPNAAPAAAAWEEGRVRLRQNGFRAEVDAHARRARLYRRTTQGFALEVTLRAALSCRLPLEGGLPLHAAGVVLNGCGLVFHGPSGVGKSTLASAFPGPVLSDELVAVMPAPQTASRAAWRLRSTGFFGTQQGLRPAPEAPVSALIELEQGTFRLSAVSPRRALTRLALATLVPPAPPLWSAALGVIGRLAREVPCYRMAWTPEDPPFERLVSALGL